MDSPANPHRSDQPSPAPATLTTLDPAAGLLVVINTYTVAPDRAEALLDTLMRAAHDVLRHVPGFVSANFHLNPERTQLVNYGQWRSREALAAAKDFPEGEALIPR